MRIAIATCRKLPEPDPDRSPLVEAFRRAGARAELVPWEEPGVDYRGFDLCLIRSTWNYVHRLAEFRAWARRVSRATALWNPCGAVGWNTDKSYLEALRLRGVATVPTVFVPRGSRRPLSRILEDTGWSDVVVKPRVGAASFATRRFRPGRHEEGGRFLRRTSRDRGMTRRPSAAACWGRTRRTSSTPGWTWPGTGTAGSC